MTDDPANSTASQLIQELHATSRTVGVLTKPDLAPDESFEQWVDVLNGTKFKVGHGYYVVMNNHNPLVSHTVARQQEVEHFNKERWTGTLDSHRERFGTLKLQGVLSKLLNSQIKQR